MNLEMEELFAQWVIAKTKKNETPTQFLALHMHSSGSGFPKRAMQFLMMSCALPCEKPFSPMA